MVTRFGWYGALLAMSALAASQAWAQAGQSRPAGQAAASLAPGDLASTDAERLAVVQAGIRRRLERPRTFYGWFFEERYFTERSRQARPDPIPNHLVHVFYVSSPRGWREDGVHWSTAGERTLSDRISFHRRQYREYNSFATEKVLWRTKIGPLCSTYLDYDRWQERHLPSERLLAVKTAKVSAEPVGQWSCIRVDAPRDDGGESTWWVSPEHDYTIVKAWHRWPVAGQPGRLGTGYRIYDRLARYGDYWVPLQQRNLSGALDEQGRLEVWEATRFTTVEWHDNDDASDLLFSMLGWTVSYEYDDGKHERHLIGGDPWMYLLRLRAEPDAAMMSLDPLPPEVQP